MKKLVIMCAVALMAFSCSTDKAPITIVTLDPGHFHAALVQKSQYPEVSKDVYVYAPDGADVDLHLKRIEGFNTREENPTAWNEIVYRGEDFLEKMVSEKKGNVMVTAGNNSKKTSYIKAALDAGFNVLADKPMAINVENFELLKECFETAAQKGLLLYDIMTERFEITTILQKELSRIPEIYGEQLLGSAEDPSVITESVHHFYKNVAGNPLTRPVWYYDVRQQGEGIADVMVHLIDLVQWECFPEQIIDYEKDIDVYGASHWPTLVSKEQFKASTGYDEFPEFLKQDVNADGILEEYANGEIDYSIKGVNAKIIVKWDFEPPVGGGDTHYSVLKGSKANLVIRQGKEQNFVPELFVEQVCEDEAYASAFDACFAKLAETFPGIQAEACEGGWHIIVPQSYRNGHEAHFGQVTQNYIKYLGEGALPEWEVPNMIAKYYTTTKGWELSQQHND